MERRRSWDRALGALLLFGLAAACDKKSPIQDPQPSPAAASARAEAAPVTGPSGMKPVKYVPREGGVLESDACRACIGEVGLAEFDCNKETGNAKAGPASGRPRKQLCLDALDCLYMTKCAAADPVNCYCGSAGPACAHGGGNGSCRELLEKALESTDFNEVGLRFGDPKFAGGVAMTRMDGSRAKCGELCGSR